MLCPASIQQARGSDFIENLNADGDTLQGVTYTVIASKYDEVTTPYQSTFLAAGPGATVHNITLQNGCPIDFSDHLSMSASPRAVGLVKNALDPEHATRPPCVLHLPVL